MSLYLAKFFHRPPGDRDRELLLILTGCDGGDVVMTIAMDGAGRDPTRRDCATEIDAIIAFREEAQRLRAAGYVETEQTAYTLRELPPDPRPKPDWQQALDHLMLHHLAGIDDGEEKLIAALATTSARNEPFYLWLAAVHRFASAPDDHAGALAHAEAARDAFAARRAAKAPFYAWSLRPQYLEGVIHDLLCEIHLAAGDPAAALAAIEHACAVALDGRRGGRRAWLLCTYFPEHQDEAFDEAHRYASSAGYDAVRALPAYAAYLRRLATAGASDAGWRWAGRSAPAGEDELRAAEQQLGTALPPDYRRFLATSGRGDLLVRIAGGHIARLRFHRPAQLAKQRADFFAFVTGRGAPAAEAEAHFKAQYGVSLRDLVPIAGPANVSRVVAIHLAPGDKHGWCYRWDHDGAWELECAQPSFAAALAALTGGIERRERETLGFLGIDIA